VEVRPLGLAPAVDVFGAARRACLRGPWCSDRRVAGAVAVTLALTELLARRAAAVRLAETLRAE